MNVSSKPPQKVIDYIHENMYYIPTTGQLFRKFKEDDREVLGYSARGYLRAQICDETYQVHNICWYLYYGEWPSMSVDHIDRNPANNKIDNLRLATMKMQALNKTNLSKCGLYVYFYGGKYQVIISKNYLGRYKTVEEATAVRDAYLRGKRNDE